MSIICHVYDKINIFIIYTNTYSTVNKYVITWLIMKFNILENSICWHIFWNQQCCYIESWLYLWKRVLNNKNTLLPTFVNSSAIPVRILWVWRTPAWRPWWRDRSSPCRQHQWTPCRCSASRSPWWTPAVGAGSPRYWSRCSPSCCCPPGYAGSSGILEEQRHDVTSKW